jgi:hypothetical protein
MSSTRPTKGIDDLETLFPEIAKQAHGWDPSIVKAGSSTKRQWKCSLGHIWEATVDKRTPPLNRGCPYCTGKKAWKGFNDLETLFPEVAKEAHEWDPSRVTKGCHEKKRWKCANGHIWDAIVKNRIPPQQSGCPYCTGRLATKGENDMKTLYPEIAKQAHGWDPSTVTIKSGLKKEWKCEHGHTWSARVAERTPPESSGCPYCSGNKAWRGFNDIKTLFPQLATEADGWDPGEITPGSGRKVKWKCKEGHTWQASPNDRTPPTSAGCPYCSGNKCLTGFNDLQTIYPEIARQAFGWDPSKVTPGSRKKLEWRCNIGHTWKSQVNDRTPPSSCGCPYCSGAKVLAGFNDLLSRFPDLASEANGWNPAEYTSKSGRKVKWICPKGHQWEAPINNRTVNNTGCPECAQYGFKTAEDAYFYLMTRPGEQQIGITNNLDRRVQDHSVNGWTLIDHAGPRPGREILDLEIKIKRWLKERIGVIPGTTENWATSAMEVCSLAELKYRSSIETDLF